jgi:hypothetical protein
MAEVCEALKRVGALLETSDAGADLADSLDRASQTAGPLGRAVLLAVRALGLGVGALAGAEGLAGGAGAEEDGVAWAEELSAEMDAVLAKYNLLCVPAPPPTFDL